ncbi:MAG: anthranilate synthase component 1 [Icmadophila ericetorum]|nr:anthranilate synthase component 1 [Icmadophila ericetorum]
MCIYTCGFIDPITGVPQSLGEGGIALWGQVSKEKSAASRNAEKKDPRKVIKTGPGHGPAVDPLPLLKDELSRFREASIPGLVLPPMTGGAVGYVGYDCVRYFEPKTARPMKDVLKVPESLFMLFDTVIAFDHFFQTIKVITYIHVPSSIDEEFSSLPDLYSCASQTLKEIVSLLTNPDIPFPTQPPVKLNQEYTSNIGQSGYESHVRILKTHIQKGDIIQAVPSQRFSRPTSIHPFNIYRHLRTVNPSPYLFYIDCGGEFQLVGASPELLVKAEKGRIITHPIAGTVKRGETPKADEALAEILRNSLKDRAEHVMLVDLARNDINRVCDPFTTTVDHLMVVQKFSHVQHLVSQVSGVLRPDQSRFTAFRSIFPAGTVSGAPKVRAMELIAELEGEKRGVYAGAVGYFGYDTVHCDSEPGSESNEDDTSDPASEATPAQHSSPPSSPKQLRLEQGAMDTCIALRTMLVKDGVAYLQAGGGIVWDSDPYEEWVETMNKLGANMQCIKGAEERYSGEDEGLVGK